MNWPPLRMACSPAAPLQQQQPLFPKRFLRHSQPHSASALCAAAALALVLLLLPVQSLRAQAPIYLEKYTISQIAFEGGDNLSRYYIFRFLKVHEGDTFSPMALEQHLSAVKARLRTQAYFQADFDIKYFDDGRAELYVILLPSPRRTAFMGQGPDEHSLRIGGVGYRPGLPGSYLALSFGKHSGFETNFPYLDNSIFGIGFFGYAKTLNVLEEPTATKFLDDVSLWVKGGLDFFLILGPDSKIGLRPEFWGYLLNTPFEIDVVAGLYLRLSNLYLLNYHNWGMLFSLRINASLFSLQGSFGSWPILAELSYRFDFLLAKWWEINFIIDGHFAFQKRDASGALDPEVPGIDLKSKHDLTALARLRPVFRIIRSDYDNHSTFDMGLSFEAKGGIYMNLLNGEATDFNFGIEIQGGPYFEVHTPGAFSTRFLALIGWNLFDDKPVAELLIDTRW